MKRLLLAMLLVVTPARAETVTLEEIQFELVFCLRQNRTLTGTIAQYISAYNQAIELIDAASNEITRLDRALRRARRENRRLRHK